MPPVVVPGPIDPVDAGMVGYRNEFDDMQAGESLEKRDMGDHDMRGKRHILINRPANEWRCHPLLD